MNPLKHHTDWPKLLLSITWSYPQGKHWSNPYGIVISVSQIGMLLSPFRCIGHCNNQPSLLLLWTWLLLLPEACLKAVLHAWVPHRRVSGLRKGLCRALWTADTFKSRPSAVRLGVTSIWQRPGSDRGIN